MFNCVGGRHLRKRFPKSESHKATSHIPRERRAAPVSTLLYMKQCVDPAGAACSPHEIQKYRNHMFLTFLLLLPGLVRITISSDLYHMANLFTKKKYRYVKFNVIEIICLFSIHAYVFVYFSPPHLKQSFISN